MKRIIPVVIILAVAGAGVWWLTQQSKQVEAGLAASGTIEARQVRVAVEVSGRVVEALAEEGQQVEAGQVLLRLDDSLLVAQRAQAEAAVAVARAQRDVVAAGPRPEQLEAARATISMTQAALAAAQADLGRLTAGAGYAEIAAAQAAVAQAQAQLESAQATQRAAREQHDRTLECVEVRKPDGSVEKVCPALGPLEEQARYNLKAADEAVTAAQVAVKAAQARLNKLYKGATEDEINAARARVAAAQAQVEQAQAQYRLLEAGPTAEQLAAADAAIAQAQAALQVLDVQAARLVVRAPLSGVVLARNVEPGEVLAAGAVAFVLGRLDELELVVYLPEDRYGQIRLGQPARVTVDSYPNQVFTGTVVYIADQAEFTPRNVQTAEGRRIMVFAVKLNLPNPDGKLKPGMPADVVFE